MQTNIEFKPKRKSPAKGVRKANSGSFKKDDPRFTVRRAIDPTTGKPISVAELARRDTHLALAVIREVLENKRTRIEMRMSAAKALLSLGWADAPRQHLTAVVHSQGSLPSVHQLMQALTSGEPLELPQLPAANHAEIIDLEPSDSLSKGAINPVDSMVIEDRE